MKDAENALPGDVQRWVEALTWHETLTEAEQQQLTSALIGDWQTWHADPENQRTFDHLSQLVADARRLGRRSEFWQADSAAEAYDPATPISDWQRTSTSRPVARRASWAGWQPWLPAVVALAATAAIAALAFLLPWRWAGARQGSGTSTFETATGGLENVHLGDGSQITLGGETKLMVDLSPRVRAAELIRGQAWFRVAHDASWPFIVRAGDRTITAVGTAFLVTRDSDRVVVTVTEGAISVSAPPLVNFTPALSRSTASLRRPPPIRVTRGEEASYGDNGVMVSVATTDTHAAIAWTQGRLIFDNEPLRYVLDDVNRYFARRIFATPSAGKLRFSGVILDGEIEEWLQRLPEIVPVDVDERPAGICIRMHARETNSTCAAKH